MGRIVSLYHDPRSNSNRVSWNRLVQRALPHRALVDADETVDSSVEAIVHKFVCVAMVGLDEAETVIGEKAAIAGDKVDWMDRVFVLALPRASQQQA
jgi:hypothetical protein